MAYRPTGYQAAAQTVTISDIDSLAADEFSAASTAIDNSSTKYAFADIYCELTANAALTAGETISVYLIPSVDGTNYGDWEGSSTTVGGNEQYFIGSATTLDSGTAIKVVIRDVELPNGYWKLGLKPSITLAATGNAVYWRPHSSEDA